MKHIHILGICGTFMGGLALLARAKGYKVTGSDANVYPPMSTQLEAEGIELIQGFDPKQLDSNPDIVVVGNAMSRGNPCVEAMLNKGMIYTSGPQFLAEHMLPNKWVLAVSGTHGKTSTASMLAWILEEAGFKPGFLIGGVPQNFGVSARLGDSPFFVVEADEYDSAFFDKRSKFVHYHPRTLVINNLEFDHADIFDDLKAIQRQFNHVIRIVPEIGKVIWPACAKNVADVIAMGCWSEQETLNQNMNDRGWYIQALAGDGHEFEIYFNGEHQGVLNWSLIGRHNMENGLMAIAAARNVGVKPEIAIAALQSFNPPKRRLENLGTVGGVTVYDDFAHHPTAIETTLKAMRAKVGNAKITVILEPRSNTMKNGIHKSSLPNALKIADKIYLFQNPDVNWNIENAMKNAHVSANVHAQLEQLIDNVILQSEIGEHIVIMSNGGFGGIQQKILSRLANKNKAQ